MERHHMTAKEQRLLKRRMQVWDFRTGNWAAKPPLTRQEEIDYRRLHHNVAATYYVAHQNIKMYRMAYPMGIMVSLGAMATVCATPLPTMTKIAALIALPLCAATLRQRQSSAVSRAKQAKQECHKLLSRFENFEQMPPLSAPFEVEYPSLYVQATSMRGKLLKLRPARWRYVADIGNELWKQERQNG